MNLKRAVQVCATSRSLLVAISLSILALATVGWNVWHHQVEQQRIAQAKAAEREREAAVASARETADRAEFKRRAREARSDARVQELYNEINQLTEASERYVLPDQAAKPDSTSAKVPDKTAQRDFEN